VTSRWIEVGGVRWVDTSKDRSGSAIGMNGAGTDASLTGSGRCGARPGSSTRWTGVVAGPSVSGVKGTSVRRGDTPGDGSSRFASVGSDGVAMVGSTGVASVGADGVTCAGSDGVVNAWSIRLDRSPTNPVVSAGSSESGAASARATSGVSTTGAASTAGRSSACMSFR
jgi:hypothetical protein